MQLDLRGPITDAGVAWRVLGDTDDLNRRAGNAVVTARIEQGPDGTRLVGTMAGPLGMTLRFDEHAAWVERRWFRQERWFHNGPLRRSLFELSLDEAEGGVRPTISLTLEGAMGTGPLLAANLRRIRAAWQALLDALPPPGGSLHTAPRRRLAAGAERALQRWAETAPAGLVDGLREHLRSASAIELRAIRAFELADRLGLPRREALEGLLGAVSAGLLELYWSVRCVRCQGEVAASPSLSDIADHAQCASCQVGFDNDLIRNIEVLFAPHPAYFERIEQRFCSFFPAASPDVRAAVELDGVTPVTIEVTLEDGLYHLGAGGGADVELVVGAGEASTLAWAPEHRGSVALASGPLTLTLSASDGQPRRVSLVADRFHATAVPASLLTTLPSFRRAFSAELLAPDVRVSTRSVCLLFTDLSDSTAMFERLGDARAYGFVHAHFRLLTEVIEAHGGTVVKTIGDAVMAAFHDPEDGFAAALQMRERFDAWASAQEIEPVPRLNVGLHVGGALVSHSDAHGLDYFGRTVNLAARTQSAARGGELCVTPEAAASAGVAAALASLPWARRSLSLKGIGEVELLVLPPA